MERTHIAGASISQKRKKKKREDAEKKQKFASRTTLGGATDLSSSSSIAGIAGGTTALVTPARSASSPSMGNVHSPVAAAASVPHPTRRKKRKRKKGKGGGGDCGGCGGGAPSASNDECDVESGEIQLSLASKLKRIRGTAATTRAPPEWSGFRKWSGRTNDWGAEGGSKNVLTPGDGEDFRSCVNECYRGFRWEEPPTLPTSLLSTFDETLDSLDDAGLFLYDAVQPGGKRLTRTSVTRTLIGRPGTTYRYLGLRLFSHPWCDIDERGDALDHMASSADPGKKRGRTLVELGYAAPCVAALLQMGELNRTLIERSKSILREDITPNVPGNLPGSADFTLTLVNKMEPTSKKRDLKPETIYGMGKMSVGWHKDSGLQDFSTIAVYHSLRVDDTNKRDRPNKSERPWRVTLRVADERGIAARNRTPALSVPLPGGSLYYLLDEFNHNHEHAVIAGSNALRYSSTHRVSREGRGTWQYIRDKCESMASSAILDFFLDPVRLGKSCSTTAGRKRFAKEVRAQQNLMTEIEFEWVMQWLVQGRLHAELHPYWHDPVETLTSCLKRLEVVSVKIIQLLRESSCDSNAESLSGLAASAVVHEDLFDVMIETTEERSQLRKHWSDRLKDPIFDSMSPETRPMPFRALDHPLESFSSHRHLAEDLSRNVSILRRWRERFVDSKNGGGTTMAAAENANSVRKGGKGKTKPGNKKMQKASGGLTKREQKKVASNWEKMKSLMGKK